MAMDFSTSHAEIQEISKVSNDNDSTLIIYYTYPNY